jgi:hypothetical protein
MNAPMMRSMTSEPTEMKYPGRHWLALNLNGVEGISEWVRVRISASTDKFALDKSSSTNGMSVLAGFLGRVALELATEEAFDVAIPDVTVRGGKIYPVAERLLARGIPFALASGYGDWALPETLRDQPRLLKPFTSAEMEGQIRALCGKVAAGRQAAGGRRRECDGSGRYQTLRRAVRNSLGPLISRRLRLACSPVVADGSANRSISCPARWEALAANFSLMRRPGAVASACRKRNWTASERVFAP